MTAALRIVDSGLRPARWNIAATAALAELHRTGRIPDTIRFHRYPRSVLIGRHQDLARELDVERCREEAVEIARRITGGGAVYMSPSILAWDIVAGRHRLGSGLAEISSAIAATVAGGLGRLGLPARANAAGDVEIEGRKVSGSGGSFEGSTLLVQGTVLIDFDRRDMATLLRAHPGAPRPASRVASLADFLGRVPPTDAVRAALLAAMGEAWGTTDTLEDLRADELAVAERLLADEIGTDDFVAGAADAATGEGARSSA